MNTRQPTRAERQAAMALAAQGVARAPAAPAVPPPPSSPPPPPAIPDPPEPKREPTATERLHELNVRRAVGGGYLIPQPAPLTLDTFRAWLIEVSKIGEPGDVEIAWHYMQDHRWKARLRNEYEGLIAAAGRRHHQLVQQAAEEQRLARLDWERRTAIARKERERAALQARLALLEG